MELSEKERHGLAVVAGMQGEHAAGRLEAIASSSGFGAPLTRMALEHAFADAWGDPHLSNREKSLLVIAALTASRQPRELGNHVRLGISNGLTLKDFEAVLVQLAPYLGFPRVAAAAEVMRKALQAAGEDVG